MARILVTGSLGQLGRELRRLSEADIIGGRATGADLDWHFAGRTELDITGGTAVKAFFEHSRPDLIINCAAYTDVDRAETQRETAMLINRDGVRFLADAAFKTGASLIHISTDFVFDGQASEPYTEDDATAPLNVYGESKQAGETALLESGCRGAVVRTSWLYSPWGKNFVKSILAAASARNEIRVVADQRGCPTSARSLAEAIVHLIPGMLSSSSPASLYHYCDAGEVSRAEFAEQIIRRAGLSCRIVPVASSEYPSTARRPPYSALDTSKIAREQGLATRPWQETLVGCLKEIKTE